MIVDVKKLRKRLKMNRTKFATAFGLEYDTVRSWEDGRRHPTGATAVYLEVINKIPHEVATALLSDRDRGLAQLTKTDPYKGLGDDDSLDEF